MTEFTCNGALRRISPPTDRLLIDIVREDLDLTGSKLGCGTGDCGACTVLLDGAPVNACLIYGVECDQHEIETIESVVNGHAGRMLVEEFSSRGAVQCGICTPGFIVAAAGYLQRARGKRTPERMVAALAGNLCRCTGYRPILEAVAAAASRFDDQCGEPN